VKKRELYAVRISGLGEGDHDFSFELNKEFFASIEQAVIKDGNVEALVTLEKKHGLLTLHFKLNGKVEVVCDRCLERFLTEIESTQRIFVKLGDTPGEIEDDVIMIGRDDFEIEVGQFMYEFIVLSLPFQRIHPTDQEGRSSCNPEMIDKLEAHKAKNESGDGNDPRWDALKGIIENN
jgi:uncharacterized metal-binding protein YceD (DUF177 family)